MPVTGSQKLRECLGSPCGLLIDILLSTLGAEHWTRLAFGLIQHGSSFVLRNIPSQNFTKYRNFIKIGSEKKQSLPVAFSQLYKEHVPLAPCGF